MEEPNEIISEIIQELSNMILTFYSRSIIREAQPEKDITEICSGTLDGESLQRLAKKLQKLDTLKLKLKTPKDSFKIPGGGSCYNSGEAPTHELEIKKTSGSVAHVQVAKNSGETKSLRESLAEYKNSAELKETPKK